ncbi:MAG: RnfH family protein [Gammaproteobacteria bacterium]|nr:RnfH family protein [Gammaproteobacteria bacterium]
MANIEVAYAKPDKQWIITVELELPASILDAIHKSNILEQCSEIDLTKNKVGIFGEILSLDSAVYENARVEIYRPLQKDPMMKRFERVKQERKRTS